MSHCPKEDFRDFYHGIFLPHHIPDDVSLALPLSFSRFLAYEAH